MSVQFDKLLLDMHIYLCEFLTFQDLRSLSSVCQSLRCIYHSKYYQNIALVDREFRKYHSQSQNLFISFFENDICTEVSFDTFLNPDQYSWFPKESVKNVSIMEKQYYFIWDELQYDVMMKNYPNLETLDIKDNKILIAHSELVLDRLISLSAAGPMTAISFNNLVPFLKSCLNSSESSHPMALIMANDMFDVQQIEDFIQKLKRNTNLEYQSDSSALIGYYDEQMKKDEQHFSLLSLVADFCIRNQCDIFDYKGPFKTELCIFPKPFWTNHLTDITIEFGKYGFLESQPAAVPRKVYKLYQLDNYPMLKTIKIYDSGLESIDLCKTIYGSLPKCQNLKNLAISVSYVLSPFEGCVKRIQMINTLRGAWENFMFEFNEEFLSHTPNSREILISNPTITDLRYIVAFTDQWLPINVSEMNKLKSLKFDFKGLFAAESEKSLDILRYCCHKSLKKLEFNFRSDFSPHIFNILTDTLRMTEEFANVKVLSITDKGERHNNEVNSFLMSHSTITEYMKYFLPTVVAKADELSTLEDAVKVFRYLRLTTVTSSTEVSFSNERFELARSCYQFLQFFRCFDGTASSYNEPIDSHQLTALYFLFAYCFNQIHLQNFFLSDLQLAFSHYIRTATKWDDLFSALLSSLPGLKLLKINSNLMELSNFMLLPHYHKIKNRCFLEIDTLKNFP